MFSPAIERKRLAFFLLVNRLARFDAFEENKKNTHKNIHTHTHARMNDTCTPAGL